MTEISFSGYSPVVHPDAFIAPNATLIGQVSIGPDASIFYGAVVRADLAAIVIGSGSNLQDLVAVHADPDYPTVVGSGVTVGHSAVLHGCTIEDNCLIGMGAVVMNGAVIGAGSLVAAGALVVGGTIVPPGSLVAGSPAKVRRELSPDEIEVARQNGVRYVALARRHRDALANG